MGQFRLRDIEEFDNDFIKFIEEKESQSVSQNSLIPEFNKNADVINSSPEKSNEEPPLIEKERQKIFDNFFSESNDPDDDSEKNRIVEDEPEERKQPKIYSVIKSCLLVFLLITVIAFVSGCFISVFLDNGGLDIGGYCFNTQCQDIDSLGIKQGDLIISKKTNLNGINSSDIICVPALSENGCDVQIVKNIYQNGFNETINTVAFENGFSVESSIPNELSYGLVRRYVPAVGKIVTFAMNNAILICILFILIAALWCVILLIIEKKISEYRRKYI